VADGTPPLDVGPDVEVIGSEEEAADSGFCPVPGSTGV